MAGTDLAPSSRKTHGGTAASAQALGVGDFKASKGRSPDESVKEGIGGSSVGGAAGGGAEGEPEKAVRGRRPLRKGRAAARKKEASQTERFFEVSATSQVKTCSESDGYRSAVTNDGRHADDEVWFLPRYFWPFPPLEEEDAVNLLGLCCGPPRRKPCSVLPCPPRTWSLVAPALAFHGSDGPVVVTPMRLPCEAAPR